MTVSAAVSIASFTTSAPNNRPTQCTKCERKVQIITVIVPTEDRTPRLFIVD